MSSMLVTRFRRGCIALCLAAAVVGSGGCRNRETRSISTGNTPVMDISSVHSLRKEDLVEVKFSGNPTPPADSSERIKEDGTISLPLIGSIQAEGKTAGQLQKEIHDRYVPSFYRQLTVTVKTELRVFLVYGEVRQPGRLPYGGQITALGAIAAAGGYTDFAARKRIELTRSTGEQFIINGERAEDDPSQDLQVVPGDRIYVPRRSPFGR